MFRKLRRKFQPNPLDSLLKKAKEKGQKRFLLGWNRGLGDIALGLYAINHRIRSYIPGAKITYLIRPNLKDGFSLLEDIEVIPAPGWARGKDYDLQKTLNDLQINPRRFDVMIEKPDPTYWVQWQRGTLTPKLKWDSAHDDLVEEFSLSEKFTYIGCQPIAETNYGLWRNWPIGRYEELFERLDEKKNTKMILFGFDPHPKFSHECVIDLRGKTNLFQLISIIKNRLSTFIGLDSGVLSMAYYLDEVFPLKVISLWADPNHGILKQNVASPNPKLEHIPLISARRDLSSLPVDEVWRHLSI